MKRTFLGILVMGTIVGLGSAGVYYAQHKFAPQAKAGETAAEEDANPTPIPLARDEADPQTVAAATAPTSPFVDDAASEAVDEERYQTFANPGALADEEAAAADDPAMAADGGYESTEPEPYADDPAAGDIPDAADSQVAAVDDPYRAPSGGSPFVGGDEPAAAPSRYEAQPVAAQVPVEAEPAPAQYPPADVAPRRLDPSDTAADGYEAAPSSNPLRSAAAAPASAANDPYGDQGGYGTTEPYAAPTAAGAPGTIAPSSEPIGPLEGDDYPTPQPVGEGTGRPGDPQLNGAQSPALVIEKVAPPEIQIGKPAQFLIKVKNTGTATARGVEIHDEVPQGTQLIDTAPPATRGPDGTVVWELGSLKPGSEQTVEMQLMPTSEGEVGSVARVHFHSEASVRTTATKPMLNVEVYGPSKVLKGQQVTLRIKLSNPGSGAASGVLLTENVPQGLSHPQGKELEFEVGTLKPGESRELDLALVAAEAGMVTNSIKVTGDAKLESEALTEIEIVAPKLAVALAGPKRRYLERNATHSISISNPGTASAKDIDLVAVLPRNLKFVECNNGGQFDPNTHAVYWSLEELPPQETGTVKLTTLPLEAGDARLLIKGSSKDGLKDESEEVVSIEGLAAINFQLSDIKDPIEVGAETSYEIRVTNQGSKAASNVRLAALVPAGMKPLSAEGPVRHQIEGQYVRFEPLRQLAPKADTVFTIKVKAVQPGDQRVEVQVATDEIREPIAKQESTRVYGDE
ncbi:MAG: DUF11 domain-containing protein [Planctomycetota bacterium]|nr:MAG: DUF11 domain-containing protein [Planctomycetota bacterium]